jgi:hypothetical protein
VKKKSPLSAFLSLLLLSTLLLPFLAVPAHAELSWNVQIVDEDASGIGNGYCPIAVDSNNNPHIAYSGTPSLGYASWNGSGWNIQQLSWAFAHDLALDANGNPHITLGSLAYGTWNGTGWNFQTVATDYTGYSSLVLDSSGNPHVAYSSGKLKYATRNGSNWTIQTVDTSSGINSLVSLALDSNDTPHIMYYTESSYVDNNGNAIRSLNLKLAVWKNSRWNIEPVLASSNLINFGNMVLDSKGYPHFIASTGHFISPDVPGFLSTILYVSWDGFAWNVQTVASDVNLAINYLANIGFLALNSQGYPSIVYIAGGVKYTRWTGTAWGWESYNVGTPDTTHDARGPCYLALDSNGNPHISSRVFLSGQILYPGYNSTIMYATANITEPAGSPAFPALPLLLASTAVIIGAIIITVYLKKRKH